MADVDPITKTCKRCGTQKPLSAFHKDKSREYGVRDWCKECRKIEKREYYVRNRELLIEKASTYFRFHKDEKREYDARRRIMMGRRWVEKAVEWNRLKKHNRKLIVARYSSRRRAWLVNSPQSYTNLDVIRLLIRQRRRCACCREKLASNYHIDHIVPVSKGGDNSAKNIQLLCPPCNLAKNAKDPIAFMQSRGFLL